MIIPAIIKKHRNFYVALKKNHPKLTSLKKINKDVALTIEISTTKNTTNVKTVLIPKLWFQLIWDHKTDF
jgi:hypothetical protein